MATRISEVTMRLSGVLGPTLVAALAGSRDVSRVRLWSEETEPVSRVEEEKIRARWRYGTWSRTAKAMTSLGFGRRCESLVGRLCAGDRYPEQTTA